MIRNHLYIIILQESTLTHLEGRTLLRYQSNKPMIFWDIFAATTPHRIVEYYYMSKKNTAGAGDERMTIHLSF
jgi:hypothetical protein